MINSSKFKIVLILTAVFVLQLACYVHAEDYKWLKTHNSKSLFVFADFNGCDFIEDKLNETIKRSFSRYDIKTNISSSMTFNITDKSKDATFELVDDELVGNNKIILHITGKCIRYTSGYIFQFDAHFGIKNQKYSQALLYATPQHSVVGIDSTMGIERTFRTLMKEVVDDYLSANQPSG